MSQKPLANTPLFHPEGFCTPNTGFLDSNVRRSAQPHLSARFQARARGYAGCSLSVPCPIAASLFIPQNIVTIPPNLHSVLSRSDIFPRYLSRGHTAEPSDTGTRAAAEFSLCCASHAARPCPQSQAFPPDTSPQPCPCACPPPHTRLLLPGGTPLPALSSPYLQGQVGRQPNREAARTARTLLLLSTPPQATRGHRYHYTSRTRSEAEACR